VEGEDPWVEDRRLLGDSFGAMAKGASAWDGRSGLSQSEAACDLLPSPQKTVGRGVRNEGPIASRLTKVGDPKNLGDGTTDQARRGNPL